MWHARVLSLLLLAAPGLAFRRVEQAERIPRDWTFHRAAEPHERVTLDVSLREQNVAEFEQLLHDVSDPTHAKYGQHLEGEEVANLLRPAQHAIESVTAWLELHGVDIVRNTGEWIAFNANVSTVETMLDTRFGWYTHASTGRQTLQTLAYSVPEHVHAHLNFLAPTVKFPSTHALRSPHHAGNPAALMAYHQWHSSLTDTPQTVAPPNAVCNQAITPQCLLNLYNVHYGAATTGNSLAFASFLTQYARYTDLTQFEASVAPYAEGHSFSFISINNGSNDQNGAQDATEANLDAQYTAGVGYPVPLFEFSTGGDGPIVPDPGEAAGSNSNEPYLRFLQGVLAMPNAQIPRTISVSYGDDEQTWPPALASKICNMFGQLGSRGVTVLFASGDNGPSGAGGYCENNDGSKQRYVPSFPASCPYVTTVGATTSIPETAASFSGGGFSNYFARPAYQAAAVKGYLAKQSGALKQYYNAAGRGYPDVSAQGENFIVVNRGVPEPVDGTSAATPTFASIVALLNSARISQKKPTLGFLNPLLYQHASALNDITTGKTTGCSAGTNIANAGWNASAGWDAATGLGTPNFDKLLKIVAPGVANSGGVLS